MYVSVAASQVYRARSSLSSIRKLVGEILPHPARLGESPFHILLSTRQAMPPKVAKAKQLVKTAASGTKSASTGRNARTPQLRRPNKPLGELYTRLAEKSNVDVSQVRQVYETTVDGFLH